MTYRGLSFEFLSNIEAIPFEFRIVWSNFVIDARTAKAANLKHFAEAYELWGDMRGNVGQNSDAALQQGTVADERIFGSDANDYILGHEGNDILIGQDGADFLLGGQGNDLLKLGGGFFNRARSGDGDDTVKGGSGIDWAHGNDGDDVMRLKGGDDKGYGGSGNDRIMGGNGRDWLQGAEGNDTLIGGAGRDTMHGGTGADYLEDRLGKDWLAGGHGNDTLVSRSDAGAPDQKLEDVDLSSIDFNRWSDRLTGDEGADEFRFVYEMNASKEVAARHLNANGSVNWMAVMRENGEHHAHWVDWGGTDRIDDFDASEGDHIFIVGHTVNITGLNRVDLNGDGTYESTAIVVYSDQSAQMAAMGMGGMPMAHDRDLLGIIVVEDAIVDMSDISLDNTSMEARFEFI